MTDGALERTGGALDRIVGALERTGAAMQRIGGGTGHDWHFPELSGIFLNSAWRGIWERPF